MVEVIDEDACVQCGTGVEERPAAAISLESAPVVNVEDCVSCGTGVDVCQSGPIALG